MNNSLIEQLSTFNKTSYKLNIACSPLSLALWIAAIILGYMNADQVCVKDTNFDLPMWLYVSGIYAISTTYLNLICRGIILYALTDKNTKKKAFQIIKGYGFLTFFSMISLCIYGLVLATKSDRQICPEPVRGYTMALTIIGIIGIFCAPYTTLGEKLGDENI